MTGFLSKLEESKPRPEHTGPRVPPSDKYSEAAFRKELEEVRTAPEGVRNNTLFEAACALYEFVNAGTLDEQTVISELTDAARDAGLDDREIEATIESGKNTVAGKARTVPESAPPSPSSPFHRGGGRMLLGDRLLTPTALRHLPDPVPLVEDTLDQGTTALLYGKWGSSKSFIALDWACCVATGKPWQGRPTKQQRVLYVVAEGVAGFASRVEAWELGWQTKLDDHWIRFLPLPVNLMSGDVDELVGLVHGGGYGFVILDTLARCMVGGDENSAKDAGIVVDSMTQIMYATPERRGVVLGVHHTGKDGKTLRGSSAFEAGVDTVYFVERDGEVVHLKRTKRKDGPERDRHRLRLTPLEGADSCVVQAVSGESADDIRESVLILKQIFSESFSQTGVSNAELRNIAIERGMSQATYYRARSELLKEGWIINTGAGARPYFELMHQLEE